MAEVDLNPVNMALKPQALITKQRQATGLTFLEALDLP